MAGLVLITHLVNQNTNTGPAPYAQVNRCDLPSDSYGAWQHLPKRSLVRILFLSHGDVNKC